MFSAVKTIPLSDHFYQDRTNHIPNIELTVLGNAGVSGLPLPADATYNW